MRKRCLLVALALLAGCGSGTEPWPLSGEYRLTAVNGAPPPGLLSESGQGSAYEKWELLGSGIRITGPTQLLLFDTTRVTYEDGSMQEHASGTPVGFTIGHDTVYATAIDLGEGIRTSAAITFTSEAGVSRRYERR